MYGRKISATSSKSSGGSAAMHTKIKPPTTLQCARLSAKQPASKSISPGAEAWISAPSGAYVHEWYPHTRFPVVPESSVRIRAPRWRHTLCRALTEPSSWCSRMSA